MIEIERDEGDDASLPSPVAELLASDAAHPAPDGDSRALRPCTRATSRAKEAQEVDEWKAQEVDVAAAEEEEEGKVRAAVASRLAAALRRQCAAPLARWRSICGQALREASAAVGGRRF